MSLYPLSLDVKNNLCTVIGAGEVARRKIESLLDAGARVKVISPDAKDIENVENVAREYKKGDLKDSFLVIAATDNKSINEQVFREAKENNILVNVVDKPDFCNFFVPSVINRGKLQITISTEGSCPALSKKIRKELEKVYTQDYKNYCEIIEKGRKKVIENYPEAERKNKINSILNDKDIMNYVKEGEIDKARERLNKWI